MTGDADLSDRGLELLAPGINKSVPINGAQVRLEATVDAAGNRRYRALSVHFAEDVDVMPGWRLDDLAHHVLAIALDEARFRARYPGTYVDLQYADAVLADEPTPAQQAGIRDRALRAMAEYDDAYRVVRRK